MPPEPCVLFVDGEAVEVPAGASVAAAMLNARMRVGGPQHTRRSPRGNPRAPLCGMGTCFECRVRVDGREGVRACLEPCRPNMRVETSAPAPARNHDREPRS